MPRMYLQVTENVPEIKDAWSHLRTLVAELSEHDSIDPSLVKAFFNEHQSWAMGEGAPSGFVNLKIAMLPRPADVKKEIADAMFAKLCDLYKSSLDAGKAAVSVEVRDMDPDTYRISLGADDV